MRRAAKVDANQQAVADVFQDAGFSVLLLHQVGKGCPDLLIGCPTTNILIEVKNPDGRGNKLTADQEIFHSEWAGPLYVVESEEQAKALIQEWAAIDGRTVH